jgi:glycosyltransferase involved in cell wall biosynthesis
VTDTQATLPLVTVVIPVLDEAGNLAPLVAEIERALHERCAYEVIVVDDGSSDGSGDEVRALLPARPWLRLLRHPSPCGKSAAVKSAAAVARAPLLVTMDGDGQNDPAFIPAFLARMAEAGPSCGLVHGQRLGRKDTAFKRLQSRLANAIRRAILRDGTRDTGCGFTCVRRDVYMNLPFFDALHRFMPALVRRDGHGIAHVDVVDRPRQKGISKYGFFDRLAAGIVDLAGVGWLLARRRSVPRAEEVSSRVL